MQAPVAVTVAEQLDAIRHELVAWQRADHAETLAALRASPSLDAALATEVEAFLLFPFSTDAPAAMTARLPAAQALVERAQGLRSGWAEAAARRVLCRLQSLLGSYLAALDNAGEAASLYERLGDPTLALSMLVMRNDVFYYAEMYAELRAACHALDDRLDALDPGFRYRVLNGAASAGFCLALETIAEDEHREHLRGAIVDHERALAEAVAQGQASSILNSHINLAVVHAFLGDPAPTRAHLLACDHLVATDARHEAIMSAPAARTWRRLAEALIACAETVTADAGWQALLDVESYARTAPELMPTLRAATLDAVMRQGLTLDGQTGLVESLRAARELLAMRHDARRDLARNLGCTVDAVIERPLLLLERDALSRQGTELEATLAARNAELSQALARLQAEASIRAAAETALQHAHDELERQVAERGAQLEQALRALLAHEKQRALTRMVAGMAHEMNTPLDNARMGASAISERCEQLRNEIAGGALRRSRLDELLASLGATGALVDRSLGRVGELVQRFRALAADDERAARFDLAELLRVCAGGWAAELAAAGVALELQIPPRCELDGYPDAVRQVLQQLLENSLLHGFGARGFGRLVVTVVADEGQVLLSWRDDGIGIAADQLPRVVEPFFTTRLGQTGVGLGLTSVHKLVVELMGGALRIDSEPGRGTEVVVRLPRHPAAV